MFVFLRIHTREKILIKNNKNKGMTRTGSSCWSVPQVLMQGLRVVESPMKPHILKPHDRTHNAVPAPCCTRKQPKKTWCIFWRAIWTDKKLDGGKRGCVSAAVMQFCSCFLERPFLPVPMQTPATKDDSSMCGKQRSRLLFSEEINFCWCPR